MSSTYTSNSFLEELATNLFTRHGRQIGRLTVVFPNRRAGYFFRKYLSARIKHPIWSPEIYSIEEFIMKHSSLLEADRITLIFTLYQAYKEVLGYDEGFDKFYGWGEMLLGDFDEIDRYLVDAEGLFRNMLELKRIDAEFSYLDEDRRRIVRNFWSSFGGELSAEKKNFLHLWENLHKVYSRFRGALEKEEVAYPGMIYRKVASEIAEVALPGNKPVVFAGFNALSRSEEQVMSFYIKERNASVFWDADQSFLDDPKQEAGVFLRRYMDHPVFKSTFDDSQFTDMRNVTREVTLLGVPHDTGQAKKAGEILHEMAGKNLLRQPEKTVVVLADEAMLFPVLYSLPSEPEGSEDPLLPVNVTMGYPLRETSLYGLLEQLVEMHERAGRRREADAAGHSYHYRHIISILRHPLVYHRMAEEADAILQDIQSKNLLSVSPEEFTSQGRPE
ncbi:MAG: PD-(D/E)XK nuclease family protein, partial [Cyclobacteriaceae bacterium]